MATPSDDVYEEIRAATKAVASEVTKIISEPKVSAQTLGEFLHGAAAFLNSAAVKDALEHRPASERARSFEAQV